MIGELGEGEVWGVSVVVNCLGGMNFGDVMCKGRWEMKQEGNIRIKSGEL